MLCFQIQKWLGRAPLTMFSRAAPKPDCSVQKRTRIGCRKTGDEGRIDKCKGDAKATDSTSPVVTGHHEMPKKKHKLVHCCEQDVVLVRRPPESSPCRPHPRVIIIGAGMAGLSAAQRLMSRGIDNFVVVEAKQRPGGRIHTCKTKAGHVVELGAQYIEGGSVANSVWNLAALEGLAGSRLRVPAQGALVLLAEGDRGGRAVEVSARAHRLVVKLKREAAALFNRPNPKETTVGEFLDLTLQCQLDHHFTGEEAKDAGRIVEGVLAETKVRWGLEDLRQLSATQYGSFIETPGGRLKLPQGAVGLMAPLLRPLNSSAIKYNKIVQTVEWLPNMYGSRALVRFCDGEEMTADYVLVTVSLGVLKTQGDKMFCPRLPQEKLVAINRLGYGCTDKIFLEYKKPFWLEETAATFHLSHSPSQVEAPEENWVRGIGTVQVESDETLSVSVAGRAATRAFEFLTDDEVAFHVTNALRRATGDGSLPCPSDLIRSKWTTDLAFCGASSYLAAGSSVADQCQLAEPVRPPRCDCLPPVLLFAGEATVPGHYGTLQAARISGVREADRIVDITLAHDGLLNVDT